LDRYSDTDLVVAVPSIGGVECIGSSKKNNAFLEQNIVSVITCVVSLVCGLISSIELYLSIQKNMEDELLYSKEFYLLSVDIYKMLNLSIINRPPDAKLYLEDKYNEYTTLVERSQLLAKKLVDKLSPPQYDIAVGIKTSKTYVSLGDLAKSSSNEEKSTDTPIEIV
jgi:hypothetical protein